MFLAHIYIGHWIRLFENIISTGKWFIWVVTSWTTTSSQVITNIIFSDLDAYYLFYLLEMKSYITRWMSYLLDVIRRCQYSSMEFSFSTCYLQVMSPGQTLRQMSPSPMFVNTKGHASHQSTYLIVLVQFV